MNQNPIKQERRRHPRLDGNVPVKICCEDFDLVTETQNLSRSGAYCRVDKFLEPMTKLKICLLLPFKRNTKTVTKKVSCEGTVVRCESVPGQQYFNAAVFFNDIQTRDADTISDFVDTMMNRKALS